MDGNCRESVKLNRLKKVFAFGCFLFTLMLHQPPVKAQNWDIEVVKALNPQDPKSGFVRAVSSSVYVIGIGAPAGVLAAGLIKHDSVLKRQSFEMFAAGLLSLAINGSLKNIINRPRPAETYPQDVFPYKNTTGQSFPSGHTSMAFVTATSLSLQFREWYVIVPAYLWATAVGYSRMYLGVHYPSDVIAGAAVGAGSAFLAHWLNRKIFHKSKASKRKPSA